MRVFCIGANYEAVERELWEKMSTNATIELALDRVDWNALAVNQENQPRIYTPGEVLMPELGFMRGHGTFVEDENIKASVAGVIEKVNKLISVRPLKSRYVGEIGDVVVARVLEVGQKRWRVDTNSRLDSVLLLSSVNLPGGELRRRSAEDEQMMRRYLDEGDLISAEVQVRKEKQNQFRISHLMILIFFHRMYSRRVHCRCTHAV